MLQLLIFYMLSSINIMDWRSLSNNAHCECLPIKGGICDTVLPVNFFIKVGGCTHREEFI